MSLNKEAQKKLLKAMKFADADITKLVDGTDEVDVTVPDTVHVFTPEELTTRDTAVTATAKADGVKEGEKQGKELAAKAFKKKFTIADDTKDLDKVAELVQAALGKGDDGLKEQVKLLQGQLAEKETAITTERTKAEEAVFNAQLLGYLPQKRKSVADGGFTDQEYLSAIRNNLVFEKTETGVVVKKGGEILRDTKTTNPLAVPDVLNAYFEERKWTAAAGGGGGRGGGNSGGGGGAAGIKTMTAFQEQWVKDNPQGNLLSTEFATAVGDHMKSNPDFKSYE